MTKSDIRNTIKQLRNQLTIEEILNESCCIQERLLELNVYQESHEILSYISFGTEVNTVNMLTKELSKKRRKQIYVPRVEGKQINFYSLTNFDQLIRSPYGILEPSGYLATQYHQMEEGKVLTLMIMPGLAFDSSGNRIGYGGGYYDRFLNTHGDRMVKIGFAYDFQLLNHIDAEPYDRKVDYIITPTKVIQCNL